MYYYYYFNLMIGNQDLVYKLLQLQKMDYRGSKSKNNIKSHYQHVFTLLILVACLISTINCNPTQPSQSVIYNQEFGLELYYQGMINNLSTQDNKNNNESLLPSIRNLAYNNIINEKIINLAATENTSPSTTATTATTTTTTKDCTLSDTTGFGCTPWNCTIGYYFNQTFKNCQPCNASCTSKFCFGASMNQCASCVPGYAFNLTSLQCVNKSLCTNGTQISYNITTYATTTVNETKITTETNTTYYYNQRMNVSLASSQNFTLYSYLANASLFQLNATSDLYQSDNSNAILVCRTNVIYVNPNSTSYLELGTIDYPFRRLSDAQYETFNSFYQMMLPNQGQQINSIIAIEKSQKVLLNTKFIVDTVGLILTTYDNKTQLVDIVNATLNNNTLPKKGSLIVTNTLAQPVINSSLFQLYGGPQYNFTQRTQVDILNNNYRYGYSLNNTSAFKQPFINMFNASLMIQNIAITNSKLSISNVEQLILIQDGGQTLSALTLLNNYYETSIIQTIVLTMTNITIKYCTFNLTVMNSYILLNQPNPCAASNRGFFIIDRCLFNGSITSTVGTFFQHMALNSFNFTNNELVDFRATNCLASAGVINIIMVDYCPSFSSPSTHVYSAITNNTFYNTNAVSSLLDSQFNIIVLTSSIQETIHFDVTNNTLTGIANSQTFFTLNQAGVAQTYLKMSMNMIDSILIGDSTTIINIVSDSLLDFTMANFNFTNFTGNNIAQISAASANLKINNLTINKSSDFQTLINPTYFMIDQATSISITNATICYSNFSTASLFTINQATIMTINNFKYYNNSITKSDVMYFAEVSSLSISNVLVKANNVSYPNKVNLFLVGQLNAQALPNLFTMQNVTVTGLNQLPLIGMQSIDSDPGLGGAQLTNSYYMTFSNIVAYQNNITVDDFLNIQHVMIPRVNVNFVNIFFINNTIVFYNLMRMDFNSQNVTMQNITFSNNSGSLMTCIPNQLQSFPSVDTTYNMIINATGFKMGNNTNRLGSLIVLQGQTYLNISGSDSYFTNNTAFSRQGMIQLYTQNNLLQISGVTFSNNTAINGGVFFIKFNSTVICKNCTFTQNAAVVGSIAYVTTDSKIKILNNSYIQNNYAVRAQLFYLNNNYYDYSVINSSNVLSNDVKFTSEQKLAKVNKTFSTYFPDITDYSFLNAIPSNASEDCSIWMMRSKFSLINSAIYSHSNFTQVMMNSQLNVTATNYTHPAMQGYFCKVLLSKVNISNSNFNNIISTNKNNEFQLFQITVNSTMIMLGGAIANTTIALVNSYDASIIINGTQMKNLTFNNALFQTRYSIIYIIAVQMDNLVSTSGMPIFNILENNIFHLNGTSMYNMVNISNMNTQIINIEESTLVVTYANLSNLLTAVTGFDTSMCITSSHSNTYIGYTLISNMISITYGGGFSIKQTPTSRPQQDVKAIIEYTTFKNCTSTYGGAIYTENVNTSIQNSNFISNVASSGGAVYFSCSTEDISYACSSSFGYNYCQNNAASIMGGCYHTDLYKIYQYDTSQYLGNTAAYGINYSAYAFYALAWYLDSGIKRMVNADQYFYSVSGQTIPNSLFLGLYDFYDQIILIENSSIGLLQAVDTSILTIDSQSSAISVKGVFQYTATEFTSQPGNIVNVNFSSSTIPPNKYKKVTGTALKEYVFKVTLTLCTYGEAISGTQCIICSQGSYSITQNAQQCSICPDHASCIKDSIDPDAGYWRISKDSVQVVKCLYSQACIGGSYAQCNTSLGYYGIICHECIYDQDDQSKQFARKGEHQCTKCPTKKANIRTQTLIFIANEFYIGFLTYSYYKNLVLEKENSIVLKIFTTYTQVISQISAFQLNWPSSITSLFTTMGAPAQASTALYSIDCLLRDFGVNEAIKLITVGLLYTTLSPFVQFILILPVYIIAYFLKVKQIKIKMLVTATVIYYLAYPQIVKDTFSLFNCTDAIEGKKYLIKNTNIVCYESDHIKLILILGLPILVLFVFGIPQIVLFMLYKKRKNLDHLDNMRTFGFWYMGIKRNRYYWEILLEYKKLMLIAVTVNLFQVSQDYQAFMILMILYLFFVLSSNLQPYKISYINTVSYYAELAEMFTFALVMIFLKPSSSTTMDNLVLAVLIITNLVFFGHFGFYYGRFYVIMVKANWTKIKATLLKKKTEETEQSADNLSNASEENHDIIKQRERMSIRKRRAPHAAKLYKSAGEGSTNARRRESYQSSESPRHNRSDFSSPDNSKRNGNATEGGADLPLDSSASPPVNELSPYRQQIIGSHMSSPSAGNNAGDEIVRVLQKIQIIKENKNRRKQIKKKMWGQDGPIGIKVEDYIREEKRKMKREKKREEKKRAEEDKEEEVVEVKAEDRIHIKDFTLERDKRGHLLNAEVLDQIKNLY